MGDDVVEFDEWLTEMAARAGYSGHGSTAELARVAGVDPGQMSRFLNGKAVPSSGNLPGLADALDVSVDEMARRIAGLEVRTVDGDNLTPEQAIAALGVSDPDDQAAVLAVIERLRARPAAPKKDVPAKPKRGPKTKVQTGESQVDPAVVDTLQSIVRTRHRRLQDTKPDVTDTPPEGEDRSPRGLGWLPSLPPPNPGTPERWFAAKPPEE